MRGQCIKIEDLLLKLSCSRVRAGNWESFLLTPRQLNYAANDALAGVNIAAAIAIEVMLEQAIDLEEATDMQIYCMHLITSIFVPLLLL